MDFLPDQTRTDQIQCSALQLRFPWVARGCRALIYLSVCVWGNVCVCVSVWSCSALWVCVFFQFCVCIMNLSVLWCICMILLAVFSCGHWSASWESHTFQKYLWYIFIILHKFIERVFVKRFKNKIQSLSSCQLATNLAQTEIYTVLILLPCCTAMSWPVDEF